MVTVRFVLKPKFVMIVLRTTAELAMPIVRGLERRVFVAMELCAMKQSFATMALKTLVEPVMLIAMRKEPDFIVEMVLSALNLKNVTTVIRMLVELATLIVPEMVVGQCAAMVKPARN